MPAAEIVTRLIEALERQDLDSAIQCLNSGVYFASSNEDADLGAHDGFRRWWELQISPGGSDLRVLQVEALDDHHVFAELIIGHPRNDGDSWSAETMACVISEGDGVIETIEMFANAETALDRARDSVEMFRPGGALEDG